MGFHVRDQRDGGMISAISEPKRRFHFTHHNPIRRHAPLPCRPAKAAGAVQQFWRVGDILEVKA